MPRKGESVEEMIANRYWITEAGLKALEEYGKKDESTGE